MASKATSLTTTLIIALITIVIVIGAIVYINSNKNSTAKAGQVAGVSNVKTGNNPTVILNKTYSAKAIDKTGKQAKSNVDMTIKTAEKAQNILIKGQPATAQNGSAFLVLQVELKNASDERLIVAPLDLLRLSVDDQKRAPEIYTEELTSIKGSVVIEPDSTKVTRVGFVLNPEIVNKQFKLQVGEINSPDKKVFDVKF